MNLHQEQKTTTNMTPTKTTTKTTPTKKTANTSIGKTKMKTAWRGKIKIDSGAAESVMPAHMLASRPLLASFKKGLDIVRFGKDARVHRNERQAS